MNQQTIRFILDDRLTEIDLSKSGQFTPTTTVLNYLRSLPGHKGVKEGCAEGDCGACTVVVAEPGTHGNLEYKALDSCLLFLPMIHGKQLITIENLAEKQKGEMILHPVQQAMVESHGSQCGYCTPGIVMSLFSLYKNHQDPSREIIEDALTGNLCRCTGYQTIIEAAQKACVHHGKDHFTEKEDRVSHLLKNLKENWETLEIITKKQKYLKPFSLKEALRLRLENPNAVVTGGSTDIALRQTKGKELLTEILDISGVEELKTFSEDHSRCVFGGGTTLECFRNLVENRFPPLHKILNVFGSLQIRNIATIGGNIGNASPIGDLLPLLFVYKASVRLKSSSSERIINIEDFIKGYRKTDLRPAELITEVIIPKHDETLKISAFKVSKRKDLDISTVSAAFGLRLDGDQVKEIMIACGGMDAVTRRALKTEEFLSGKIWNREIIEQAMNILRIEFTPISDARAGAEYRALVAGNLLLKFFLSLKPAA